jgi:hypothetical protein
MNPQQTSKSRRYMLIELHMAFTLLLAGKRACAIVSASQSSFNRYTAPRISPRISRFSEAIAALDESSQNALFNGVIEDLSLYIDGQNLAIAHVVSAHT